ncbi:MAG: PAS domain S-box protein [Chloroflexi bacterium]|nr:PAS domain S-box protein [Chloroflexota bacterium]
MHRLLERQLQKLKLDDAAPPDSTTWSQFLARINQSYVESDQDRTLLERSLSISSAEMHEIYEQLREASELRLAQERQQAAEALRESERRYQQIIEQSVDVSYTCDLGGVFTYISPQVERLTGHAPEELVGKHFTELIPDEWKMRVQNFYLDQLRKRTTETILEFPITTQDGQEKWVEQTVKLLTDGKQRTGIQSVVRDITERRQAEEAIRESETRYRTLFETANDAIFTMREDRFIDCNPKTLEVFGVTREQILGQPPYRFSPEFQPDGRDSKEKALEKIEQALAGKPQSFEWRHIRYDGTPFDAEVTLERVEIADQIFLQATVRDVTERKRLEQAMQESLDRRERQVQTGTEIAQDIASAPALPELYQRVVTLVKERFGYYHAQIFRYDPARNVMVLVTGYGPAGEQMRAAGHALPYGQGVVGTAAATGEPVLAADVTQDPHWVPHPTLPATRGELAVPITLRAEVLGILDVQSDTAGALTEEDLLLLQGLAGQIAVAIESTRLAQESRRREQQARALYEAGQLANILGESLAEGLQDFFSHLSTLGDFDRWWVTQLEPDGQTMIGLAGHWENVPDVDMRRPIVLADEPRNPVVLAVQNRQSIIINDPMHDERLADLPPHIRQAAGKYITVPIMVSEQAMGAFSIGRSITGEDIGPADEELARTLTSQVAQAAQNAQLFEQTHNALDQVQQSQQFLTTALNSIPNPVFVKDEHGVYIMCNQAFLDYLGTTAEQIIGKSVYDLSPKELADQYHEMDLALFRNPGTQVYESSVQYADGTLHDVIFNKATFSRPDGTLGGLIGTIVDITERKRAELETQEALREAERLYQMVSREGWQSFRQQTGPIQYQFVQSQIVPTTDLWHPQFQHAVEQRNLARPTDQSPTAAAPLMVRGDEVIGVLGIEQDPQRPLSPQDLQLLQATADQVSQALERARLFQQAQDVNLLLEARLQELDVLNDMGRHIDQVPAISEFLQWAAERMPAAMQYPDECRVAIALNGDVYGATEAIDLPCQIVQSLRVGDEVVGQVYVAYTRERQFPDGASALLGDIVRRVSGYIENRRLLDRLQASLTETSTLYRVGQAISQLGSLEDTFQVLAQMLTDQLGYSSSWLALVDPAAQRLQGVAGAGVGMTGESARSTEPLDPTPANPTIQAVLRQEVIVVNDIAHDERAADIHPPEDLREIIGRMAAVPIRSGAAVVGVISVARPLNVPRISQQDVNLLVAVAGQSAIAYQNAHLFDQTQTALARTEALYEASRAITAAHNRQEIVDALLAHVDRTNLDRIMVTLVVGTIEGLPLVEVQSLWDRAGQAEGLLGSRFTAQQVPLIAELGPQDVLLINDIATSAEIDDVTRATFTQLGGQDMAVIPISAGQHVLGWLLLQTTAGPHEFTEEGVRPYITLTSQAAVALEGQQLLAETERRARREQLIREITTKIRASTDLDTILNTAVRELTTNLGVARTFVQLGSGPEETT